MDEIVFKEIIDKLSEIENTFLLVGKYKFKFEYWKLCHLLHVKEQSFKEWKKDLESSFISLNELERYLNSALEQIKEYKMMIKEL